MLLFILFVVTFVGMYTGDAAPEDQHLFVCEQVAFKSLCRGLAQPCSCHRYDATWEVVSTVQVSILFFTCLLSTDLFFFFCTEGACAACAHLL